MRKRPGLSIAIFRVFQGIHRGCSVHVRFSFTAGMRPGGPFERLRAPFGVAQRQQRQVQQPLAGIVDDVEIDGRMSQCTGKEAVGLKSQHQA
jgi:hypothetical protein